MRDPRKDPQAGDVLIYGPLWQRERVEVTGVEESRVHGWSVQGMMSGISLTYSKDRWLEWMETAEVIHAAL